MTNGINVLRNASTYITFSKNDHITKVSPCNALGFMLFICRTGAMILIHKGTGAIVHQNQPRKSNSFDRSSETQQHRPHPIPSCGPGYGDGPSAEAVYCLIALVAIGMY